MSHAAALRLLGCAQEGRSILARTCGERGAVVSACMRSRGKEHTRPYRSHTASQVKSSQVKSSRPYRSHTATR